MYQLNQTKPYDVVAIGNAILDVLSFTTDEFLASQGMTKGTMQLIDAKQAIDLYQHMGQAEEVSGGSAANTLAGIAQLGAKTAFIGKVYSDQLGEIYRHDLTAVGVEFKTPSNQHGKPTGRSYILVTPDAERTMNTYLGAGSDIHVEDVDAGLMAGCKILYGEGYQWSTPHNKDALRHAFKIAKQHGAKVAFTLSDVFCVEAHRADFQEMLNGTFDILFSNEAEIGALFPGKSLEEIIDHVQGKADIVVITRGEHGSIILTPNERVEVKAQSVAKVVDTTGAGDLYAAGFLYGMVKGLSLEACGNLGSACAAAIIQQLGARSQKPLKALIAA